MNPSAPGWIDKFGALRAAEPIPYRDMRALDADLRACGFMYGINVGIPGFIKPSYRLSQDEKAKINLLAGLYCSHRLIRPQSSYADFIGSVRDFYKSLELGQPNLLQKILRSGKTSVQLEKILDSRVYLGESVLSRTFNSLITNVLLPIDVLAYRAFLNGETSLKKRAGELESLVINIIYHSLDSESPSESRKKLREAFENSRTYLTIQQPEQFSDFKGRLEKYAGTDAAHYFLDIATLTALEQNSKDTRQQRYVLTLGGALGYRKKEIAGALRDINAFFKLHSKQIYFLREALPGSQYYESMARVVDRLISRNSKRLRKELSQSKELMILLSKSTVRELSPTEKKKVQQQLLDIFKSIPSLAIFLLPGGVVLLPIFISLIPKLLPSSFDENRVD
ncbi:LETM1-related biofilm-associated protein [Robiginitalea aurantiaca]|uniref:LETM1-related biofilm-associated protein n=1 Tax=Robiginitalea aurantiaca TaxID=3056915 RepID=A0ABT7WCT0_9FLAO|nr:LETM1-related biofilm-associated protein [Robiginitalea aurantiaca]MDM9630624.1 LETM1-related biofilm-associated protein [Robiginitalea aurantiaca]